LVLILAVSFNQNTNKMQQIKNNYLKVYGYTPTDTEVLSLYLNGSLSLTDKQENEILIYFNL
jgi:hypothetical protein